MGYLLYIDIYIHYVCHTSLQISLQVQALRNAAGPDILEICGLAGWFWKICSQKLKPVEIETPYLKSG